MPDQKKTCFVVMGFGKKTDYQTGRVLDLDKSYQYIIKPAAIAVGLDCKRADEIVHAGVIDVPMYDQLLSADVVVADVSTSNPNAFYELGVRHALRPYTTITIAEDKMTFPFDISHLVVRKYHHLGEDIGFGEVERMRAELAGAMKTILENPQKDSPVYTFFADLEPPARKKIEQSIAQSAPAPAARTLSQEQEDDSSPTVSMLLEQANAASARDDFMTARSLLSVVRSMAPRDSYVAQKLALATYQSAVPSALTALQEAKKIVSELNPAVSTDTETLGLWGAIHKRLWNLTKDRNDLDTAITAYEKGFHLKNDHYNGINAAFLYDVRSSVSSGTEAMADSVIALRIRKRVLQICQDLLARTTDLRAEDRYWIFATEAQAFTGLGDADQATAALAQANALKPANWMREGTAQQLAELQAVLKTRAALNS